MWSGFVKKFLKLDYQNKNEEKSAKNVGEDNKRLPSTISKTPATETAKSNLLNGNWINSQPPDMAADARDTMTKLPTALKLSKPGDKFALKHLNLILCVTYLTIFVSASLIIIYLNQVMEANESRHLPNGFRSELDKVEIEQIVENYLIKQRKLNKRSNFGSEKNIYSTIINTERPFNLNNYNNKQNVQNERKIADHLAYNTENTLNFVRIKRESLSSFEEDNDLLTASYDEQNDEPKVEFFNPKMRPELEKKDAELMKKTGLKGAAPGGDSWVWLTSYSRIPYDAISGHCKAAREYCPVGPPGLPGIPGPKGNRGDAGLPGSIGIDGREGKSGPRGPKGEVGFPGNPGLDARDGIPGEPGLDGVPGRAGADGKDGRDGKDGIHGINGENGKNGEKGAIGPPGIQGNPGPPGTYGPRGRLGKAGTNGTPGIPGINAWKVNVNGTSQLLIPPSIATAEPGADKMKAIIVREGDHLRLRCAATGQPRPHVEWTREDGKTISVGAWQASSIAGHTLNITKVNRVHMGAYKCLADNGVPPVSTQTFQIDVHFAPLIRVRNQIVYAANGTTATLECEVEAFPEPVRYWERVPTGRLIEHDSNEYDRKYFIDTTHTDIYKTIMRLNITKIRSTDYGEYHCISKNEMGTTRAVFHVQDPHNPNKQLPEKTDMAVFGTKPPEKESFEDICGPPTTCPDCPDPRDFKCKDTIVSLYDLKIKPTGNISYPALPNRTEDCLLYAVGKPVYHKFTEQNYGAWLKDSLPKPDLMMMKTDALEKIWATKENDSSRLYEYVNKSAYRTNTPTKIYRLQYGFKGNAHVVYNGSFYYHAKDSPNIIRYDLFTDKLGNIKEIPGASSNNTNYLYTTEHNLVDFNVEGNGLWIIYSTADSNHTIVAKLDSNTLEIQYSWNISVSHHKVGEMFIICGVLYAIDSVTERNTKIRLALDLYHNKLLDVSLTFTNPFRKTTTVGYNHKNKELYTWDKGNQLTYPIRYHVIGINHTSTDKTDDVLNPQMHTGYEVFRDNTNNNNDYDE